MFPHLVEVGLVPPKTTQVCDITMAFLFLITIYFAFYNSVGTYRSC